MHTYCAARLPHCMNYIRIFKFDLLLFRHSSMLSSFDLDSKSVFSYCFFLLKFFSVVFFPLPIRIIITMWEGKPAKKKLNWKMNRSGLQSIWMQQRWCTCTVAKGGLTVYAVVFHVLPKKSEWTNERERERNRRKYTTFSL